jgi:hypothetical protein
MSISRLALAGVSAAAVALTGSWLVGYAETPSDNEFKPIMEAELPTGFPPYTPVGRIEVKRYPVYRMARAQGGSSFWTLFMHIKRNNIEMTAPVQLDYGSAAATSPRESAMAFLYGDPRLGNTGKQGRVSVTDVPATEVVSIGVRGKRTRDKVAEARQKLVAWLEQSSDFTADGDLRVMAYNSPFVPRDRQFFEVQIPVRKT